MKQPKVTLEQARAQVARNAATIAARKVEMLKVREPGDASLLPHRKESPKTQP